jgi:site-specific recombinase XerD
VPTVSFAYHEYLADCDRRALADDTIQNYRRVIGKFAAHFQDVLLEELTLADVLAYVDEFASRRYRLTGGEYPREVSGGLSVESVRGYARSIRIFLRWCSELYQLPYLAHIASRIRLPPKPRQSPKFIDPKDLARLILACGDDEIGLRDRALLCFLADTGCRVGGLLGLTLDKLDLARRRALVHEKGGRTRPVPFSAETAEALRVWLKVRPKDATSVFCGLGGPGRFFRGEPLSRGGLHAILVKLAARAGVTGRCNAHSFRHGFARTALTRGMNMGVLAQILGHRSIQTTIDIYGGLSPDDLSEQHEKVSPIKGLLNGETNDTKGGENET